MTVSHLLHRLYLNGHTGIANDSIYLYACISTPITQLLLRMAVMQIGIKFLNDQVLKGMAVFVSTSHHILPVKQMIGNTHIKIIESGSLNQTAFHHFSESRYAVAYQRVL